MSTVPAAPPIKYVLGYRSRTQTRTLTLNPKPNTITDRNPNPNPNPKINQKQNDTGMKLNIKLYVKVDFLGGRGWGRVYKRPITGTGKETHFIMDKIGYSRLLVVLFYVNNNIMKSLLK